MKLLFKNKKYIVSIFLTILTIFCTHISGYADITLVSERTPQVRDAIVAAVPGVNNAADVTAAHLAAITSLNLRNVGLQNVGITALKVGDFSGMTALTSLNLVNNQLSSLPPGIFEGLTSLTTIRLGWNTVDPFPITVTLEKVVEGQFKVVVPTGATFDYVLPIRVANGSINGGATTVTIPQGSIESEVLTVTRTAGTTAHVAVDIGAFPRLPYNHYGYALVKPDNLPLAVIRGINTGPVFSDGTTATRSVAENTARGVDIGAPVSATDADRDTLTYSLSGIDAASFDIDRTTGHLKTKAALDYETKNFYWVMVAVSDGYGGSDRIVVIINITDVHENRAPVFTNGANTTRTIAENTASGTNIGSAVSATDADNDTLTYTLDGTDAASFDIDKTTGHLKTKAALDYETKNFYSVTVSVSDGYRGSDSITVTINVTDVHENRAPVFTNGANTTRTIAENTASGTNIGSAVSATDADNNTLTYTLDGTDAASFNIDSTTGQLKTKAALDYETKNFYSVTVSVSDGNGGSDSIDVPINVTDVNETPANNENVRNVDETLANSAPVFTEGGRATRTVAENTPAGTNIGAPVAATDADNDTLTYSLGWVEGSPAFSIDSTNGQLRTKASLDYETKNIYSFAVFADDGKESIAISVTINVTDVNETPANNAPIFTEGTSTTRSVVENTASGTNIGSAVSATDADNDTLTYSLGGTDASSFSIVSTSGQLQTSAALDYETKKSYSVTVSVSDGNGGTDSIDVTINVTDVNETPVSANNAPAFTEDTSTTRSIAENTTSGTNIGSAVSATDADNDTLTYSLSGTDASSFSIVSTSGQLQTSAALDYETKTSYSVTVSVSDGNGGTDSITVTISVTDVDETPAPANNAPAFTEGTSTTRSVAENTTSGTNIGSAVSATDADNDTLTYSLGGTDAASFSIVSTSGQLQTSAALDYEKKTSYSVTVSVSDGNGGTDSITVTISVTDVDETPAPANNAPAFTEGTSTTRSVAENTTSGTNIGSTVSATDADTGDTLTYSLGGTDASSFSIVSTSGQLQTSAALDYETKTSYSVTVSVSDGNGGTDSIDVTISVTDVDETPAPANNAPVFTEDTSTTRSVAENTTSGTNIGSAVSATDADNDTLTYSLGGTDASSFSIVSTSGQLQTSAALDYETKTSYSVTVSVSDGNGGSDSIDVTINVTDVNETGPTISSSITTCSVSHKSGNVYDVTIEGTVTGNRNVRSLTVHGYVNDDPNQIGRDRVGFLDAGETKNFSITGTWTHDGSTSQECSVIFTYQTLGAPSAQSLPAKTALLPNFPNPFNPETWIPYQLAEPAEVTITIYDVRGSVVRTLLLGNQPAGLYRSRSKAAHWDGRNQLGEKVATGVYFYTLKAGDYTATRKLLIRK